MGIYVIDRIERIDGELQQTQGRLVEAWAELHRAELLENWNRLQAGRRPLRIAPLR